MKKRVKLFTTIASLCLAVALMAFGVYAAGSATFTVGGTVSFGAGYNVYLDYTSATLYKSTKLGATAADAKDGASPVWVEVAGTAFTAPTSWTTVAADGTPIDTITPGAISGVDYTFAEGTESERIYSYLLEVTFTTKQKMNNFSVSVSDATVTRTNYTYASTATNTTAGEIAANTVVKVTILVNLTNPSLDVSETAETTTITFTNVKPTGGAG